LFSTSCTSRISSATLRCPVIRMPVEARCRLESLQLGAGGTLATEIEDLSRQVPFPETLRKARFAFPIRLKWWVKLLSARVDPCCWTRAPRAVKRRGPCSAELCFSALCSVLWLALGPLVGSAVRAGCIRDPLKTYRYAKKGLGPAKRGNSALLAIVLVRTLPASTRCCPAYSRASPVASLEGNSGCT